MTALHYALEEMFISKLRTTAWLVVSRHSTEAAARHAYRVRQISTKARLRVTCMGRPL